MAEARLQYDFRRLSSFGLRALPRALVSCKDWNRLSVVLTDLTFIEAKCAGGLTDDLMVDYELARTRLPENAESAEARRSRDRIISEYVQAFCARHGGSGSAESGSVPGSAGRASSPWRWTTWSCTPPGGED